MPLRDSGILFQQPKQPLLHFASMRRCGVLGGDAIFVLHETIPDLAEHLVIRVTRFPAQVEQWLHVLGSVGLVLFRPSKSVKHLGCVAIIEILRY